MGLGRDDSNEMQPVSQNFLASLQVQFADAETSKESIRLMLTQLSAFIVSSGSTKLDEWVIYSWGSIVLALLCIALSRCLCSSERNKQPPEPPRVDRVLEAIGKKRGAGAEARVIEEASMEEAEAAALPNSTAETLEGANDMTSFAAKPNVINTVTDVGEAALDANQPASAQKAVPEGNQSPSAADDAASCIEPAVQHITADMLRQDLEEQLTNESIVEKQLAEQKSLSLKSQTELEVAKGQLTELHSQVTHAQALANTLFIHATDVPMCVAHTPFIHATDVPMCVAHTLFIHATDVPMCVAHTLFIHATDVPMCALSAGTFLEGEVRGAGARD
jgi:hypothetical protein